MRRVLDTNFRENQNMPFVFSDSFFAENRVVYEIKRKNVVEPEKRQVAVKYGACSLQAE
jgi:hypothetical protein